ncbi:MAG TPA: L-glutamate gamma-semialdehyde dehydrogenase [Bacteroidales bacterium]|nr:L-glutamate gamma-semialdehyde dehydrogenase [Bacteroidales bacterium]
MPKGFFKVPKAKNEPARSYAPGTKDREELKKALKELKSKELDIPMIIGGKEVRTDNKVSIHPPHELNHTLGYYHKGDESHVKQAIEASLEAKKEWAEMPWYDRASIFLKIAELLTGPYRYKMNAAAMLATSKNCHQAEIETVCEFADFMRYGVDFMSHIYDQQVYSPDGMWNKVEYRPLEGFIFALTPFNFQAITANLPGAPAMMGNTVVWKPSKNNLYAASVIMEIFREAGVPDGVINMIFVSGPSAGKVVFEHPDFAGFHFTGSTAVFQNAWGQIGQNIKKYKSYPRIVGETGGKDYIFASPKADAEAVATAITRGAFEYQGQKCSAASRVYLPSNLADQILESVKEDVKSIKVGSPEDFTNFVNAVIDESAFEKHSAAIDGAKKDKDAEIVIGGEYDKSEGYYIYPTVIKTTDPHYYTMEEELFGPIVTVYVYDENKMEETLDELDNTSIYGLTGAIFSQDRYEINWLTRRLEQTAGNFYINDKPTGSVVGQQPFGGARGSGTNDKAGSYVNQLRWVSMRSVKETFVPAKDYRYPWLEEE